MKPHNEEQTSAQTPNKAGKQRFRIEKLEERIAPAKGGIPGKPPSYYYSPPDPKPCHGHHSCKIP